MRIPLLFLALLSLTAADHAGTMPPAMAAAAQRQSWVWFGRTEAAAQAQAHAAGQRMAVMWRDGVHLDDAGVGIRVAIHAGYVIEAQEGATSEGCRELGLVRLLGQSEADATAAAAALQRPVRVIWRDGQGLPATMDYHEQRLNLHVRAGVVWAISGG